MCEGEWVDGIQVERRENESGWVWLSGLVCERQRKWKFMSSRQHELDSNLYYNYLNKHLQLSFPIFQVTQSTISRFACRIIAHRTTRTTQVYAAGFDSSRNIFLGVSEGWGCITG